MAESYSVKAVLCAEDKNFSSMMKSCSSYADNLKNTLTSGIGFGAMAARLDPRQSRQSEAD